MLLRDHDHACVSMTLYCNMLIVQSLIEEAFAPTEVWGHGQMDFFSIDIDGMEYHLLKQVLEGGWAPRVIASE